MTFLADEKKRRSLATLYRTMPTAELERRLRAGGLAVQAQRAAEAELERRSQLDAGAADVAPEPTPADDGGAGRLFRASAGVVAGGALAWCVVSPKMAAFVPVLVLPWILAPAAKSFPRTGLVVGLLFALLPVALLAWGWTNGELRMKGGDFNPLGALIAWAVLSFAFLVCWSIASVLVFGARHRGSWDRLHRKLQTMRKGQIDAIGKLRG